MRMTEEELNTAGVVLSAHEQRSTKAERQLISIKKARFISKFVGQEFEGVISSVVKFGVFVLLRTYDVDGLVKVEQLGNDYWVFDDENLRLIGKRTGMQYKIGDTIKIQVVAADTATGKIDFNLAGADEADDDKSGDSAVDEFGDKVSKKKTGRTDKSEARFSKKKSKKKQAKKKTRRR